jgi:dUTP pyrophosphatase
MRATDGAAGYDLHACEETIILPGTTASVRTGVCLAMPAPFVVGDDSLLGGPAALLGVEAQVRGRSGLAFQHGIVAHVGTIDSDYRGEIAVLLHNTRRQPYRVRVGDRVAQLVFAPVLLPELVEVEALTATERGAGGFGSTGR